MKQKPYTSMLYHNEATKAYNNNKVITQNIINWTTFKSSKLYSSEIKPKCYIYAAQCLILFAVSNTQFKIEFNWK